MPDEKKLRLPEVNFLPPLDMVLTFFDRTLGKRNDTENEPDGQKKTDEKKIEKLIEKLSEKEE